MVSSGRYDAGFFQQQLLDIGAQRLLRGEVGIAQGDIAGQPEHGVALLVLAFAAGVAAVVELNDGEDIQLLAAQNKIGHLAVETVSVGPSFCRHQRGKRHLRQHRAFRQGRLQQVVHLLFACRHDGFALQPQRPARLASLALGQHGQEQDQGRDGEQDNEGRHGLAPGWTSPDGTRLAACFRAAASVFQLVRLWKIKPVSA